jgi:N-sulfoglucosamine sulfohydrolase
MRVIAVLCSLLAMPMAAGQPNILFLFGDNWSYEHAGANGCEAVRTPAFDRLAAEGMRFTRAFCPVPSCSPTRSCLLTGRAAHQLKDAASLWSKWPTEFRTFTDALVEGGYQVGYMGKGWAPGNHKDHGREMNPAGPEAQSFREFMAERKQGQPFFFWQGSVDTSLHKFKLQDGPAAGIPLERIRVPGYLPDEPLVRREISDYLAAVEQMDAAFADTLAALKEAGELDQTVVFCLSDNGWQMPRGLANCHDSGCHVPLVVRWPEKIRAGSVCDSFVSLTDLAPTFIELASMKAWPEMTGRSILGLLQGTGAQRYEVFLERERHANVRKGDLSYPCRAVRTGDYLYIWNLRPERWPAGEPELYFAVGPWGDVDPTRTKDFLLQTKPAPFFDLCFSKRPTEELYDLKADRDQIHNLAASPQHEQVKAELRAKVEAWMKDTQDPRVDPGYDAWDLYPYFGNRPKQK